MKRGGLVTVFSLTLMSIILLLSSITLVSATVDGTRYVAFYNFEDVSTTSDTFVHDVSGNGNNGELKNGAFFYTLGTSNLFLGLDGVDDYLSVPDSAELRLNNQFSISVWVKPEKASQGTIISKDKLTYDSTGAYDLYIVDGKVRYETNNQGEVHSNANSIFLNEWNYVTVVYNNPSVKIYVDGVLKGEGTVSTAPSSTNANPVLIGRRGKTDGADAGSYFMGKMDDLLITTQVLTDAEVRSLYDSYDGHIPLIECSSPADCDTANGRTCVNGDCVTQATPECTVATQATDCAAGEVCNGAGVCVVQEGICTDTDNGLNYYVKGIVITSISSGITFEDYCLPGYTDQLIERHCLDEENPSNFTVQHTCPYGCENGVCITSTIISTKTLVAYYSFDNCSKIGKDYSGNGLNAINQISIGCGGSTSSQFGKSLKLYGNSYLEVPDDSRLDFTNNKNFTISFWINTTKTNQGLLYKGVSGGNTGYYVFMNGAGKIGLGLYDSVGLKENYTLGSFNDGQWHFFTGVYLPSVYINGQQEPPKLRIYKDGVFAGWLPVSPSLTTNNDPLYIGAWKNTGGSIIAPFNGSIDDLRIYDSYFNSSDVVVLHNLESPLTCTTNCNNKQCGNDGCGGTCSPGCSGNTPVCNSEGVCVNPTSTCTDSDGGLMYYLKGTVTTNEPLSATDYCSDNGYLQENFCPSDNLGGIQATSFQCPLGCSDGACISPTGGNYCESIGPGKKKVSPKTVVQNSTGKYYCDPSTLTYIGLKASNTNCIEDYECTSNICIDGKCTSLREKIEEQTSFLKRIWCAISNFSDFLKRNDSGETSSNNDYLACVNA